MRGRPGDCKVTSDGSTEHLDLVRVGTVEVKVMFKSGLGDAHRRSALMKRPEEAMLMEAWDAVRPHH